MTVAGLRPLRGQRPAEWALQPEGSGCGFPYEKPLYRLFVTQYVKRADARRAGFKKWRLDYWVFTEEENSLIPDFYAPANDFMARLGGAGVIRKVSGVGEWEVCGPNICQFPTNSIMF